MEKKTLLKNILIYAGIAIFFALLSYGFVPQVLSGKIINQSDHSGWKGMTQEIALHNSEHPDDKTLWTNSMFGGMPTVTMYDEFKGDWTAPIYKALNGIAARPANWFLLSLIGGFLLFLAFGTRPLIAAVGAVAITFCSYNLQIIQVGHNTKMQAIAFMPWVLAGLVFTYRKAMGKADGCGFRKSVRRWLPATVLGSVLFALALSFQIKANHPQITYYLAIVIFIYAIVLFIKSCMGKDRKAMLGRFFTASALLLCCGLLGIASNLNKLIPTYQYAKYTMRGGSELTADKEESNKDGLDLTYATAWSYGIEETPNLLIPDFNGGASSGAINPKKSETYELLKRAGQPNLNQVMKSLPLYWGPQPFTAGPMYMGAISIFLFVLGLAVYRGKEKWWLLIATLLAIMLAWGSHFMWFTKLWFEYAPMYNKFRTVSMALVVLQVTLPLLGFITLDKILKNEYPKKSLLKGLLVSTGITAGFCLICALIPSIAGSFTGKVDMGQPDVLIDALAADRRHLLASDALRSLTMIVLTAAVIFWAYSSMAKDASGARNSEKGSDKASRFDRSTIAGLTILALVCIDMMPVGKRYLNSEHFTTKREFGNQFALRPVDKIILEDEDPDYRVLDISVNTFNDSHPSYHHKAIGGYSPAKLQRYQDLIERYISPEINSLYGVVNKSATIADVEEALPYLPVLSMLNGKYIIIGDNFPPVLNRNAFGHCWFVSSAAKAETPDEEIGLLANTDLRQTAVIGKDFAAHAGKIDSMAVLARYETESADSIALTYYAANELRYSVRTRSEQAAVFSEIYYPSGWKAWIEPKGEYGQVSKGHYLPTGNAKEIGLFRADWILRAAILPAGEYDLVMRFEPESYTIGENLSRCSSIILVILLLLSSTAMVQIGRKNQERLR